jgi:mono/diheme cytochrome c family protein
VKRKMLIAGGVLTAAIFALGLFVQLRGDRVYGEPMPDLHASRDPALVERGRHLFHGPAYCIGCHGSQAEDALPTGCWQLTLLPGTFRAPNLTQHPEHGLGKITDGQIARMLRYGIRADGHLSVPIMQYENLSDQDVVALLSYLRSLPSVESKVPASELNLLGRALVAFDVLRPQKARAERADDDPGRYLAVDVANCQGCHTQRNPTSGAYTGPVLGGGLKLVGANGSKTEFVSPNITRGGKLRDLDEPRFVARMRAGRGPADSPMPWEAFARCSDEELRAIYRYLAAVPAVH